MSRTPYRPAHPGNPFTGPLWRASFIGFTLVLLTGASWVAIVYRFGVPPGPQVNPRRSEFARLWPSVSRGEPLSAAVDVMGPPDEMREESRRIPDCAGPCVVPCDTFHTCVVEYEWLSTLRTEAADIYSVCADSSGIVRSTSIGLRFHLNTAFAGGYAAAEVLAWGVQAFVLAIPLAYVLRIFRRRRPKRMPEINQAAGVRQGVEQSDAPDEARS